MEERRSDGEREREKEKERERERETALLARNKYERAKRVLYSNKNNHLELAGTISKVFLCARFELKSSPQTIILTSKKQTKKKTLPTAPKQFHFVFLH